MVDLSFHVAGPSAWIVGDMPRTICRVERAVVCFCCSKVTNIEITDKHPISFHLVQRGSTRYVVCSGAVVYRNQIAIVAPRRGTKEGLSKFPSILFPSYTQISHQGWISFCGKLGNEPSFSCQRTKTCGRLNHTGFLQLLYSMQVPISPYFEDHVSTGFVLFVIVASRWFLLHYSTAVFIFICPADCIIIVCPTKNELCGWIVKV
mmetsp:Transcript_27115/g.39703  ORF Transcript_27115/g.39703 Transcript_27115/m.39703 type:complete len:205 (+) Transcript_27115:2131-2745(+)